MRLRPAPSSPGPIGLAAMALLAIAVPASAAERFVNVQLDQAQIMRYPDATETVVVGNPIVVDVTMLRNAGEIILTGKGFGETNLLFLDGRGTLLEEARLRVREAPTTLVVQHGADRQTYACHPRCQPTVTLGDSSIFLQRSATDIQTRNALASGAASNGPAR